jgi:putative hydrolase of the HAD superfamily
LPSRPALPASPILFGSPGTRAVVFDYYGTLTVPATVDERAQSSCRVARALGVPPEPFLALLRSTFAERFTGRLGDIAQTLQSLAARCGCSPTADQVQAACTERRVTEGVFASMVRPEAVETLRAIRARGLCIGVLSDCTHELVERWDQLPVAPLVDVPVFSVEAGERKPHPSLYRAVSDRLGVEPGEVVYVGDGGSHELTGASLAGMTAVRLVTEDNIQALVYDQETDWAGPVVHALGELLAARASTRTLSTRPREH